jgi:hypothetical protein
VLSGVLFDQPLGSSQQQFLAFALNGRDQLRQRVAWALHKIWGRVRDGG